MKENFITYKLSQELAQTLTKYDLPVGNVYWVLKSLFVEVEKMYFDQVQKEIDELQVEESNYADSNESPAQLEKMEGEIVNERNNDLDNE